MAAHHITHMNKKKKRTYALWRRICCTLLVIAWLFSLSGCSPERRKTSFFALGTICTQNLYASQEQLEAGQALVAALEEKYSYRLSESDVARVNEKAGSFVKVSEETFSLVKRALELAQRTDGAFDPTLGVLTQLWDITGNPRVPSEEELQNALAHVGYEGVELDEATQSIKIQPGQALDLGGIAKGDVADRLADFYRQQGVTSGSINLGGNVYILGHGPDGSRYRVGIRDPQKDAAEIMGSLEIEDGAVVLSGAYERYFEEDGVRYHHILDPKTGYPAESDLLCVAVLSEDATLADAFTTAVFVLGSEEGLALLKREGLDGLLVREDGKLLFTEGFQEKYAFSLKEGVPYAQ